MSKDAQKQVVLMDDAKKKLDDCVAALAAFGPDGLPLDGWIRQSDLVIRRLF